MEKLKTFVVVNQFAIIVSIVIAVVILGYKVIIQYKK
jgi:hypothetical protein